MDATLETISSLERRISISVPMAEINSEVVSRISRLSKTVRVAGFRPGKVPVKIVERQHGGQVRSEVMSDVIGKNLGDALAQKELKIAGLPKIDVQAKKEEDDNFVFIATFEVYPAIAIKDIANCSIDKPTVSVGDAEVDSTLGIMQKQRANFVVKDKVAEIGDQIKLDFKGSVDGELFEGGAGEGVMMPLGEGRLLADFENALTGLRATDEKSFDVQFPDDYPSKDLAGKKAQFEVKIHEVLGAVLPEINADFAKQLGFEDGDVGKLRVDVKKNVDSEVRKRLASRQKDLVMKALLDQEEFDVPQALIDEEGQRLAERMKQNMESRGLKVGEVTLPKEMFVEEATRRVKLGLIIAYIAEKNELQPKPYQLKEEVEEMATGYEKPQEIRDWYYKNPQRLRELESFVVEKNVVTWALEKAQVKEVKLSFDELMGIDQ
ncbi:MAG: trigger factor [Proteobacteria bacterium]|nr:trigger factor [Pseudomonadota bacterium]MDA1332124.1 trigger factor [Pseudomonadota bacterium]